MADSRTDADLVESMNALNVEPNIPDDPNPIIAFCHGSVTGNGTANCNGGIASYFPEEEDQPIVAEEVSREDDDPVVTNVRAQYLAAQLAIDFANDNDPDVTRELSIYTNDKVLVDSMTEWIYKWQRNGWRTSQRTPVENRDILELLFAEVRRRDINWIHVTKKNRHEQTLLDMAIDASRGASSLVAP